jgi:hypothetical protein
MPHAGRLTWLEHNVAVAATTGSSRLCRTMTYSLANNAVNVVAAIQTVVAAMLKLSPRVDHGVNSLDESLIAE